MFLEQLKLFRMPEPPPPAKNRLGNGTSSRASPTMVPSRTRPASTKFFFSSSGR